MQKSLGMKWRLFSIFIVIIFLSFFPSLLSVPSSRLLSIYTILMRNIALLLCVTLSYRIYRVHKATEFKIISKYIFITFFFWVFSGFSWVFYYVLLGRIPILSLADFFFFIGYIALFTVFTSTIFFYRNFITRGDIATSFLIWILISISGVLYLNSLKIYSNMGFLRILFISFYPILDSMVIFLLLVLLFMYRKTKIELYLLVFTVSIIVSSIGDVFLVYYNAYGIYFVGSFPDNTFLFCLLFIAFGFSVILKSRIVYFTTSPLPEREESSNPKFNLEKGKTYLFEEVEPRTSIEAFYDIITHGVSGFALLRSNVEKTKKILNLERTPVLWFSSVEMNNTVSPSDLGKLAFIISEFIRKTKESVILIEGIEYLIIQNDFLSVLKILNGIGDLVVLSDSRLILTLNPYTLTEKEKALLERGFEVYRLESQG